MNEQIVMDTINSLGDSIARLNIELAQAKAQINYLATELNKKSMGEQEEQEEVTPENEQG